MSSTRKKGDKVSLYLDYYSQGKRQYEYLQLYLTPDPEKGKLTKEQKEENRKTLALAEAIWSKRHLEIQNGIYGFQDPASRKAVSCGTWSTWQKSGRIAPSSGLFSTASLICGCRR